MKKIITFAVCLMLTLMTTAEAQENNRRKFSPEHYKARLEKFITEEAGLTKEEGEKFFPMLHEMMEKQRETNRESFRKMKQSKEITSDADFQKIVMDLAELEIKNKQIEKEYYAKFNSAISWERILKVRQALHKFNMEALKSFTPRRQGDRAPENRPDSPNRNTRRD